MGEGISTHRGTRLDLMVPGFLTTGSPFLPLILKCILEAAVRSSQQPLVSHSSLLPPKPAVRMTDLMLPDVPKGQLQLALLAASRQAAE